MSGKEGIVGVVISEPLVTTLVLKILFEVMGFSQPPLNLLLHCCFPGLTPEQFCLAHPAEMFSNPSLGRRRRRRNGASPYKYSPRTVINALGEAFNFIFSLNVSEAGGIARPEFRSGILAPTPLDSVRIQGLILLLFRLDPAVFWYLGTAFGEQEVISYFGEILPGPETDPSCTFDCEALSIYWKHSFAKKLALYQLEMVKFVKQGIECRREKGKIARGCNCQTYEDGPIWNDGPLDRVLIDSRRFFAPFDSHLLKSAKASPSTPPFMDMTYESDRVRREKLVQITYFIVDRISTNVVKVDDRILVLRKNPGSEEVLRKQAVKTARACRGEVE